MNPASLFATVPERDVLQFGQGDSFNPKLVADWMGLDKQAVSRVAGVSKSSVRFDENIPRAVRERLEEIASIANMVAGVFEGDGAKTALWFRTKNPMLGDVAPRDMVRLGRYERLRKFVVSAIGSNQRPLSN